MRMVERYRMEVDMDTKDSLMTRTGEEMTHVCVGIWILMFMM